MDVFGQLAADTFHPAQILDSSLAHAVKSAKGSQQVAAARGAYTRDVIQFRADSRLAALGAMAGDGEAVRFVADLDDEMERGRLSTQSQAFAHVRKDQRLETGLAPLAFRYTHHYHRLQPDLGKDRTRGADLTLAAVDQDQIRAHALARRNLAIPPLQRLTHRREVVTRRDAVDVVAAIFGTLHGAGFAYHAGRHRGLAHGVADVEALNALRSLIQI